MTCTSKHICHTHNAGRASQARKSTASHGCMTWRTQVRTKPSQYLFVFSFFLRLSQLLRPRKVSSMGYTTNSRHKLSLHRSYGRCTVHSFWRKFSSTPASKASISMPESVPNAAARFMYNISLRLLSGVMLRPRCFMPGFRYLQTCPAHQGNTVGKFRCVVLEALISCCVTWNLRRV